jgi:hypothetical protein
MITKKDAIEIGKAIVRANLLETQRDSVRPQARWSVNGATCNALLNLWYDVFPEKTKAQFDYSSSKFIELAWDR